jgi:hypothetical protein
MSLPSFADAPDRDATALSPAARTRARTQAWDETRHPTMERFYPRPRNVLQ